MSLIKCPRCELNYMNDTDKMCSVCRREVRGESESFDMIEMCSECGENPVVPGQELCAYCLKEFARRNSDTSEDGVSDSSSMELDAMDAVSSMNEIDLGDDLPDEDFGDESFEEDLDDEDKDDLDEDGED